MTENIYLAATLTSETKLRNPARDQRRSGRRVQSEAYRRVQRLCREPTAEIPYRTAQRTSGSCVRRPGWSASSPMSGFPPRGRARAASGSRTCRRRMISPSASWRWWRSRSARRSHGAPTRRWPSPGREACVLGDNPNGAAALRRAGRGEAPVRAAIARNAVRQARDPRAGGRRHPRRGRDQLAGYCAELNGRGMPSSTRRYGFMQLAISAAARAHARGSGYSPKCTEIHLS
jgi:hypothetical protein